MKLFKKLIILFFTYSIFQMPSFALFDLAAYGSLGSNSHGAVAPDSSSLDSINSTQFGGFADYTLSLPIPVVNVFLGAGVFVDSASLEKSSNFEGSSFQAGGQLIAGVGISSFTLFLRPGFGYAGFSETYADPKKSKSVDVVSSGSVVNFNVGLNYKILAILNAFVEIGLPQYDLTREKLASPNLSSTIKELDYTASALQFHLGIRVAM